MFYTFISVTVPDRRMRCACADKTNGN